MNIFESNKILPDNLIEKYMEEAIKESIAGNNTCSGSSDVPVGCIIVDKNGAIVARGHNTRKKCNSVTGHAEINAIEEYSKKNNSYILEDTFVFVTLEPCPMCAGALAAARPKAIYYGAPNTENGSCGTIFNIVQNTTKVYGGIRSAEISSQLSEFFKNIR